MKKSVVIITVVFVLIALSCVCANAEEGEMIYDMSNVFDSLSDDIKQSLQNMGVDLGDFSKLANLSFENVMGEILSLALGNISSPLKGLVNITALLLLCSVISAYNGSLSCDISNSLNITATLCITCAAVVPAVGVIASTGSVICTASNIMLAYVPVMAVIMVRLGFCGRFGIILCRNDRGRGGCVTAFIKNNRSSAQYVPRSVNNIIRIAVRKSQRFYVNDFKERKVAFGLCYDNLHSRADIQTAYKRFG